MDIICHDYTSADCKTVDTDCNACADSTWQKQKCWLFPIRWPDNYIRTTTGAKVKIDCTVCPNGYYWLSGSNTKKICPRGFYCVPGATQKVIPCPAGLQIVLKENMLLLIALLVVLDIYVIRKESEIKKTSYVR